MVKKILKTFWKEFIYGGHFQCLGLVGIAYISGFLLNIKVGWEALLSVYLIFYPIYINDRWRHIEFDRITNPERTEHFKNYFSYMSKLILASILFLIILLIYIGNLKFFIFSLILLIFGLLYPYYFKDLTKKIIAFKNFYVASFFSFIAVTPVIYYFPSLSILMTISLATLMFFVFLKAFLMQIFLDCKDIETDKPSGFLTIPALIGREKAIFFLKISSFFITTLILLIAVLNKIFPPSMLAFLLTIPFNFYSYNLAKKQNYFGYILVSGEFFFWLILILFIKIIAI